MSTLDEAALATLARLLRGPRWVTLATTNGRGEPLASQVACAVHGGEAALLLHLSELAAHTRNLLARPLCSLSFAAPDDGREDPQTLARVTVSGDARVLERSDPAYPGARDAYLARFPAAPPRFDFGDFHLFRVDLTSGQFVGGFANAARLGRADLERILALPAA